MDSPSVPPDDTPVEIYGYKTDPLRRGYQILWNYESTFWAALVGNNDAWRLYEVLRSFCHEKNPTCKPSIRLLTEILALKERRVLTGWVKKVKGKEYKYPGLIEALQRYELVTAEVKGQSSETTYLFHVNLTPGLLSVDQLTKLSPLLQQKHKELLQRCEQAKQELKAKQRPSKIADEESGNRGGEPVQSPSVNYRGGSVNYQSPPVNYRPNNTHITLPKNKQQSPRKKSINNNSSGEPNPQDSIVVALTDLGISKMVATRLASRYTKDRILEKIEFLTFLQETHPDQVKKNPAGWLRRAIEEDFAKPAGFLSAADREAKADERERHQQENARLAAAQQAQDAADREKQEKLRADHLAALRRHYSTSETETTLWQKTLSRLEATDPTKTKTFLAGSHLLTLTNGQAVVWFPHHFARREAEHHFSLAIQRLLAHHLNVTINGITLTFLAPDDLH